MSFQDGMAALNLQAPDRVPRTECSAEGHWKLINAVLGTNVDEQSPEEERQKVSRAFMKAWNYDFIWSVDVLSGDFGDVRTRMGHAKYAAGDVDFDQNISSYFKSVDDVLAFDAVELLPQHTHSELVERFNKSYAARRG